MSKSIGVRIPDPEVWNNFITYVYRKWGKKHSAVAIELQQAIIEYMEKRMSTLNQPTIMRRERNTEGNSYAHALKNNDNVQPNSKTMKTLQTISEQIKQQYQYEVSQYDIERIIRENAGGDPKTLNKYITLLQEYNHIIPSRPIMETNKFIFRVNGLETIKT